MDINKINTQVLGEESTLGIYVWEMPDGRWIGDDEGNFLSITSKKNNKSRVEALAKEVRNFGIYEGQPSFLVPAERLQTKSLRNSSQDLSGA